MGGSVGLKRLKKGDNWRKISASTWNFFCNFFETLNVVGGQLFLTKTGHGCQLVLDYAPLASELSPAQWHCVVDPETWSVTVDEGSISWGGGQNATWLNQQVGDLREGQKRYVMWHTNVAPRTEENRTHWDATGVTGEIGLFTTPSRREGWTDCHLIAIVERKDGGVTVDQIQTAAIFANPQEHDDAEGEVPSGGGKDVCASGDEFFPSRHDSEDGDPFPEHGDPFPTEGVGGGGGALGGDGAKFPSKVDKCW